MGFNLIYKYKQNQRDHHMVHIYEFHPFVYVGL